MNIEPIRKELIEICSHIFQYSDLSNDVLEYLDFADDLGMDSVSFVSLVIEIENYFNITIPDDMLVLDNFRRIDTIVPIIETEKALCQIKGEEIYET